MKSAWFVVLVACGSSHTRPDATPMADARADAMADATLDAHPLGPPPLCADGTPATLFEDFGTAHGGSDSCGNRGSFGASDMGSAMSGDHILTVTAQPFPTDTHGSSAACAWSDIGGHGIIASGSTSPASAVSITVRTTVSATVTNAHMVTSLSSTNALITQHMLTDTWRRFGPAATADMIQVDESVDGQTWSSLGQVPWMGGWPASVELDFLLATPSGDTAVFGPIYTCP